MLGQAGAQRCRHHGEGQTGIGKVAGGSSKESSTGEGSLDE